MPPRLPIVLVFFAVYFAVIVGGTTDALTDFIDIPAPFGLGDYFGTPKIRLTIAEIIGASAALFAAPDAALRPARSAIDRTLSVALAAAALVLGVTFPEIATVGYGGLTALALGDAFAALLIRPRRAVA